MRYSIRFTRILAVAVVLLTLLAGRAAAGGQPRAHDGFFMRLSAGFGAARAEASEGSNLAELSGPSVDANLAAGWMVAPNLALHGTLWGWTLSDPDANLLIGGVPGPSSLQGTLYMGAAGVGATYYFMPANAYVSASLGSASLTGTDEVDGNTDNGFAMDVTVGKEWWVGDSWGLGVSGDFIWFSCKDDPADGITGSDPTWSGPAFGIRFSATFN